ncbi:DUF1697 domain-containing protein [Cohnella abietis]|uniref:DUF1697 domain-containing protein n=1 Tax=Cohnella abietis TaxID=2507935 RepID=A0A3T1CYD3_9BACL|nr:DUF1697 domain-containing protein [Cohnella abietis]BBI30846.1 hypothetical protein KCTCHS21_02450 [Cohnella abietis]
MVYVALLRGINVGGNNKINMKLLSQTFERVGMGSVMTYINTGNILFTDSMHSKQELCSILEEAIYTDFGLAIKVIVRSIEEYTQLIQSLPDHWTNDQSMRSDVLFLWDEINDESVIDKLKIKPEIDRVQYIPGAILWSVDKEHVTRSGMSKIIGTKIYQQITVRNVNTTRKIYELMLGIAKGIE